MRQNKIPLKVLNLSEINKTLKAFHSTDPSETQFSLRFTLRPHRENEQRVGNKKQKAEFFSETKPSPFRLPQDLVKLMHREGKFRLQNERKSLEKLYLKLFDGERAVLDLFIVLLLDRILVSSLLHCSHRSQSEQIRGQTRESERAKREIASGGKWRNCEKELKEAPQHNYTR